MTPGDLARVLGDATDAAQPMRSPRCDALAWLSQPYEPPESRDAFVRRMVACRWVGRPEPRADLEAVAGAAWDDHERRVRP